MARHFKHGMPSEMRKKAPADTDALASRQLHTSQGANITADGLKKAVRRYNESPGGMATDSRPMKMGSDKTAAAARKMRFQE